MQRENVVFFAKGFMNESACDDFDKTACSNDKTCSWCTAGAVPSACYSVEDAHKLPAGVFECDFPEDIVEPVEEIAKPVEEVTQPVEEVAQPVKDTDDDDDDIEATCNSKKGTECSNDIGCSWCTAGAVPSSCHSIENAHKLPAGVFDCVFPEDIAKPVEEIVQPVVPKNELDVIEVIDMLTDDNGLFLIMEEDSDLEISENQSEMENE